MRPVGTSVDSMKGFQRLKTLNLHISMLLGPPYDKDNVDLEKDAVRTVPYARLVDLLPASVRTFRLYATLFTDDQVACIIRLFDGFRAEREAKLPNLEDIAIVSLIPDDHTAPGAQEAMETAARAGASIIYQNDPSADVISDFFRRNGFHPHRFPGKGPIVYDADGFRPPRDLAVVDTQTSHACAWPSYPDVIIPKSRIRRWLLWRKPQLQQYIRRWLKRSPTDQ